MHYRSLRTVAQEMSHSIRFLQRCIYQARIEPSILDWNGIAIPYIREDEAKVLRKTIDQTSPKTVQQASTDSAPYFLMPRHPNGFSHDEVWQPSTESILLCQLPSRGRISLSKFTEVFQRAHSETYSALHPFPEHWISEFARQWPLDLTKDDTVHPIRLEAVLEDYCSHLTKRKSLLLHHPQLYPDHIEREQRTPNSPHPPTSFQGIDELTIVQAAANGERDAQHHLVTTYHSEISMIAKRFSSTLVIPRADLINEGKIALLHAAKKYKPDFGLKFWSYATWWVQQRVLIAFLQQQDGITFPIRKAQLLYIAKRKQTELSTVLRREPTVSEIAQELDQDPKELAYVFSLDGLTCSLDASVGTGSDKTWYQLHDAATESDPVAELVQQKKAEKVQKLLSSLSLREQTALTLFFQLKEDEGNNYAAIGKILDITREGARQMIKRTLDRLQWHPIARELRQEFLV